MPVETRELRFPTTARTDVIDITPEVARLLGEISVGEGLCVLFVPGSTGALTTIEHESGVLEDLTRAIDRVAPETIPYAHDARWGDGNGYSHVRAALIGPSLHIPVIDGKLALGRWQQIVLLDFDNRPRERRILAQFHGD
jgi:secondary thiamine-phosphate synthase enzyme